MSEAYSSVKSILKSFHTKDALYYYDVSHDGYDKYGPQSELYDLYVLENSNVYHYHDEDWFDGNEHTFYRVGVKSYKEFFDTHYIKREAFHKIDL
jgi:hypothetical protein